MPNTDPRINRSFDRTNAVVAAAVWLIALIVYTLTKAPTVSFWDCGEFIAAAHILGVAHPPGSPLYILLARLFSIIPFFPDIAVRINWFSSVCNSLTALFGYLIVVRLLRTWLAEHDSTFNRLILYGGGFSGALFAAFGMTNWNNSVEAEVYGLAMMLTLCVFWLALIYFEHRETMFGEKIMLLTAFVAFLGVGVHMTVFLAVPIVALFFIIKKDAPRSTWFAVSIWLALELYMIFAMSSRPGEVPYYIPVLIVGLFYFLYVFSFEQIPRLHLLVGGGFILAVLPLFVAVYSRMRGGGDGTVIEPVGITLFVLLNAFAGYLVMRHFRGARDEASVATNLVPAGFVGFATLMVLLLWVFKGYLAFAILTIGATLVLAVLVHKYIRWEILIAIAASSMLMIDVRSFAYGIAAGALIIVLLGFVRLLSGWKTALMILLCAVAGFSVNAYIPIRAADNPNINENNPNTIAKTIDFIDRKQYGSESMVERMFKRRGAWENQFGNYRRMGFWRFFHGQFGMTAFVDRLSSSTIFSPKVSELLRSAGSAVSVFPILIGLFGFWEIVRRRPRRGLPLVLLLLLCSVGLVLYMNFADGTRQSPVTGQDYLEVRDRDYFFTPAFILFGLSIGIGLSFLVLSIRQALERSTPKLRNGVSSFALLVFLTPAISLAGNWFESDRSGNFIPYDYAANLLNSAKPNSILFTHGDNDTFPLWCLQEVYHYRTDVRIVNLSLANTTWYVGQVKNTMDLALPWSDAQIDSMRPQRQSDGSWRRLQDMVVDALIDEYLGKRPIYFSVTVGAGARRYQGEPLDSRLRMSGMLFEVIEPHGKIDVDVERSFDFFMNEFRSRSIADKSVYKDEATRRLTTNYGNAFLMVADTLRKAGDLVRAEQITKEAIKRIPYAGDPVEFLGSIYSAQGRVDSLRELINTAEAGDMRWLGVLLARAVLDRGDTATAVQNLTDLVRRNPSYRPPFDELMRLYFAQKNLPAMKDLVSLWVQFNPNDKQMRDVLRQLQSGFRFEDLDSGDTE